MLIIYYYIIWTMQNIGSVAKAFDKVPHIRLGLWDESYFRLVIRRKQRVTF